MPIAVSSHLSQMFWQCFFFSLKWHIWTSFRLCTSHVPKSGKGILPSSSIFMPESFCYRNILSVTPMVFVLGKCLLFWHDICQTKTQPDQYLFFQCHFKCPTTDLLSLNYSMIYRLLRLHCDKLWWICVLWVEWKICSDLMSVCLTLADKLKEWIIAFYKEEWQFYSQQLLPHALLFNFIHNLCMCVVVCYAYVCGLRFRLQYAFVLYLYKTGTYSVFGNIH